MQIYSAQVVIVGSGIAGSLAAYELSRKGFSVLILEAGDFVNRSQAMNKYYSAAAKTPESAYDIKDHAPYPTTLDPSSYLVQKGKDIFQSTYLRVVGGTTWHWLGATPRLLPTDFKMKSTYNVGEDWPLTYDELEPWYTKAEKMLGVAGSNEDQLKSPRSSPYPQSEIPYTLSDLFIKNNLKDKSLSVCHTPQARNSTAFEGRPPCCGSASCIPCCPVQAKYDATVHLTKALQQKTKLIHNAVVYKINTNTEGKIESVLFKKPDGTIEQAKGQLFILAANAIETSKILLMSRSDATPQGVANSSDEVGRNLSDHPIRVAYALTPEPIYPFRGPQSTGGIHAMRDGAFRDKRAAYRLDLRNDGWRLAEGGFSPLLSKLVDEKNLEGEALKREFEHISSRMMAISCEVEQLPDRNNRIVPSNTLTDALGIPRPEVTYSINDYTQHGLNHALKTMQDILAQTGCTDIKINSDWYGAGHIMGTYRMGTNKKTSVVNAYSQSHDHPNLYLLGSGVMPTMGTANPTLTLAALALMASDHILKNFPQGHPSA